ncbi:MAG: PadR family transcriptional regulator [Thaumarchaeota archaeon]|nr:PadR family transcriptional regulator [Nitrososphaerota archaeon]
MSGASRSRNRETLGEKIAHTHREHRERAHDRLHRRMGPQSVPRGFLRMYVLALTQRQAETGYSIMQHINERTRGAWRPGPGTIYPLLKTLAKEGLVKPLDVEGREDSVAYAVTEKGNEQLEAAKREIFEGANENKPQVMMGLMSELFRPDQYTSFFLRHYRAERELFEEKVVQLNPSERESVLAEMEGILESQISWIRSLRNKKSGNTP